MSADRSYFENLAAHDQLTPAGLELALRRLGCLPAPTDWRHLADRLLLAAGSLLILAGIVCFFAFNWKELHRYAKLGLIAAPFLAAALLAAREGCVSLRGKALLGAACGLTGVLLATAGQIYQSGADSELLFAGWALLILPWVLVGRMAWLWLFWLLLANTALGLFLFGRFEIWALLWLRDGIFWAPILLNLLAAAVWESLWPRLPWLRAAYAPRLLAFAAGAYGTVLMCVWWFFDRHVDLQMLQYTPIVYLLWLGATFWHYRQQRRDLVPLAFAALSAIVVITAGMARGLLHRHADVGSFLLIGLAVAGMTAFAAHWLRALARQWQEESHV